MPDYYPMHRIDVFIPKIVFIKPIINNMIHFSKKKILTTKFVKTWVGNFIISGSE